MKGVDGGMANSQEQDVYEAAVKLATGMMQSEKWGKLQMQELVDYSVDMAMEIHSAVRARFSKYR